MSQDDNATVVKTTKEYVRYPHCAKTLKMCQNFKNETFIQARGTQPPFCLCFARPTHDPSSPCAYTLIVCHNILHACIARFLRVSSAPEWALPVGAYAQVDTRDRRPCTPPPSQADSSLELTLISCACSAPIIVCFNSSSYLSS